MKPINFLAVLAIVLTLASCEKADEITQEETTKILVKSSVHEPGSPDYEFYARYSADKNAKRAYVHSDTGVLNIHDTYEYDIDGKLTKIVLMPSALPWEKDSIVITRPAANTVQFVTGQQWFY